MHDAEWTTEDLFLEPPVGPGQPRLLFHAEGMAYEYLGTLQRRGNGQLLLKAQRRRHREGPGAPVLIRTVPRPMERSGRVRLLQQMELATLLHHPASAQLYFVHVTRERPLAVMEYVAGPSLEALVSCAALRRQPLSMAFTAHVAAEVADALHFAHTLADAEGRPLGLVHRDVSPRNVRVSRTTGEVKLMDWGSAYSAIIGREETPRALRWGDVAYASPEYLEGGEVGPASDVFSLGLTLLELLTGRHLLDVDVRPGQAPLAPEALPEVALDEEPSVPLRRVRECLARLAPEDVERAVEGLPDALAAIVLGALRREPSERPRTAGQLRDELRAWLVTQPRPYERARAAEELTRLISEASASRDEALPAEGDLYPDTLEEHELG